MLAGKNLMSPSDLTIQELDELFVLTDDLIKNPQQYSDVCRGKSLSTLFFEPSTRTRLSFEAAMHRLGGGVFGFSDPGSSSATKGETVADTARMIGCYADIVAMRHPNEGAPQAAALYCNVPVINAGDGGHQHPTQTLTDLYTIRTAKGRLDHLVVGLCGDLKFGRTVHSLIQALCRYEEITFVCISPKELVLPDYIYAQIPKDARVTFEITENLEDVIDKLDVCYMTRVQKERFDNEQDYLRLKDVYILDTEKMEKAKQDMIVLHPLPRVGEIKTAVDSDPRAMYFAQAQYGMYVRMALICKLLGVLENQPALGGKMHLTQKPNLKDSHPHLRCANPKCLCNVQTTLPRLFCESNDKLTCYYCDHEGEPI